MCIRDRLKKELEDVKRHREVTRQQRGKDYALTAAIVGYTNAGKSTLLNRLTGAGILAEDKLFATLDPTTRSFTLADGQQILLTDTVGFINKLPHHLVEAFKSTLAEARYCDIVLNVVDCSDPQMDMHCLLYTSGNLYAIYATPAENLCGLQVKQFRKKYGIIENVSDREYVSNGFHCHVTEDITPIQKQDLEYRFWELSNGGKIQYVKYPVSYNKEAIRTLVRRAMRMGFYEGVNLSLAYCDDCGHEELEMDVCPVCGSKNLKMCIRDRYAVPDPQAGLTADDRKFCKIWFWKSVKSSCRVKGIYP